MLGSKAKRELKINQRRILIDSIEIGIPSPQQILTWGERLLPNGKLVGEIKNSKTVNYKRFTPLRDGLFCERIFGPVNSFICACGKRQPRADIKFCDKCEVEYTDQRVRRYRLGYIPLVSPVAHIWYLKGRPSYISLFLGKRKKKITALAYCNAYLVEQAFSNSSGTIAETFENQTTTDIAAASRLVPQESSRSSRQSNLSKDKATEETYKRKFVAKSNFLRETTDFDSQEELPLSPIQRSWIEKRKEHGVTEYTKSVNSYAKIRQVSKIFDGNSRLLAGTPFRQNSTKVPPEHKKNVSVKYEPLNILQYKINNKTDPSSFYLLLIEVLGKIEKDLVLIDFTRNNKSCTPSAAKATFLRKMAGATEGRKPNKRSFGNVNIPSLQSDLRSNQKGLGSQPIVQSESTPLWGHGNGAIPSLPIEGSSLKDTETFFNSLQTESQQRKSLFDFKKEIKEQQSSFFLKPLWGYTYSEQNSKDIRHMDFLINSNRNPISTLSYYSLGLLPSVPVGAKTPFWNGSSTLISPAAAGGYESSLTSQEAAVRQKRKKNNKIFSTNAYIKPETGNSAQKFIHKFYRNLRKTENTEQIQSVSTNSLHRRKRLSSVNSSTKKHNLSISNAIRETKFCNTIQYLQYGMSSYNRAQTLPFLPTLICKYHLRDDLLNFFYSSPLTEDIPIPIYCNTPRWTPLRNVHQFMSEQILYNNKSDLSEAQSKESLQLPIRKNKLQSEQFDGTSMIFHPEAEPQSVYDTSFFSQNGKSSSSSTANKSNGLSPWPLSLNKNETHKKVHTYTTNSLHFKINDSRKHTLAEHLVSARHILYMGLLQKSYSLKTQHLADRIRCLSALFTSFSREKLINNSIRLYPKQRPFPFSQRSELVSNNIESLDYNTKELCFSSSNLKKSSLYIQPRLTRLHTTPSFIKGTRSIIVHDKRKNKLLQQSGLLRKKVALATAKQSLFASMISYREDTPITKDSRKPRNFKITSSEKLYSALLLDNSWARSSILKKNLSYLPVVTDVALARLPIAAKLCQFFNSTGRSQKTSIAQEKNSNSYFQPDSRQQALLVPSLAHALRHQAYQIKKEFDLNSLKSNMANVSSSNRFAIRLSRMGGSKSGLPSVLWNGSSTSSAPSLYNNVSKQSFTDVHLFQRNLMNGNANSLNSESVSYFSYNNFKSNEHLFEDEKVLLNNVIVNNATIKTSWTEEKRLINKSFNLTAPAFGQLLSRPSQSGVTTSKNKLLIADNRNNLNSLTLDNLEINVGTEFPQAAAWDRRSQSYGKSYTDNPLRSKEMGRKRFPIGRLPLLSSPKTENKEFLTNYSAAQSHALSPLELTTIREILAYTGGGALQQLLQRFNTQRFATFLLGDIQATQALYKKRVTQKGFPSSRLDKRIITRLCRRIYKNSRRLKIAQLLTRSKRLPEWMLISALPVLPPDLRPILQMSESVVVASDLNNLYQRVIYRNNRFQKLSFIDFHLVTAIQRLVQDAVDRLIENGRGGSKPFYTSSGRPLKSLSDTLKGKKGRFRLNLLGKRVDFSGRSVIVVSPNLKIHECGLPREIALELYHYFLLRHFMLKKQASSIVMAKRIIKQRNSSMWNTLRAIIYHHPVLLNRAPTLHRLGIQAFQPKLVRGNAILLHPLVCSGFNADFDGDQMGVHLPLCIQARAEAWDLLWSRNNLLSPATGQPVLVPSQDMVLGFYYMTQIFSSRSLVSLEKNKNVLLTNRNQSNLKPKRETDFDVVRTELRGSFESHRHSQEKVVPVVRKVALINRLFFNSSELIRAFQNGQIFIHTPVWLKWEGRIENDDQSDVPLELRVNSFGNSTYVYSKYKRRKEEHMSYSNVYVRTTAGRVLVNQILFSLTTSY